MPDPAVLLEAGAKALLYAAILVAIGANAARWLLLPRTKTDLGPEHAAAVEHSVARLALAAACLASGASVLRVWTHTVSAFGSEGARSWDTLALIAWQSRWGQGWRTQMIASAILTAASAATLWRRAVWPLATLAVLGFAATIPLLGHAAGHPIRMAVDILHILGAGVWLGTLAVVVLIRVPQVLHRFSPVALPGAATVVAAGVVASFFYVGAVSNLWTTPYGRVLVLKAALVAGISACGYLNWRRLRARNPSGTSSTVLLETILSAAVVIVTGYLTETGHP